jgi:hypothetical protein
MECFMAQLNQLIFGYKIVPKIFDDFNHLNFDICSKAKSVIGQTLSLFYQTLNSSVASKLQEK